MLLLPQLKYIFCPHYGRILKLHALPPVYLCALAMHLYTANCTSVQTFVDSVKVSGAAPVGVVSVPDPNQPQHRSLPVSRDPRWGWFESGTETTMGVASRKRHGQKHAGVQKLRALCVSVILCRTQFLQKIYGVRKHSNGSATCCTMKVVQFQCNFLILMVGKRVKGY